MFACGARGVFLLVLLGDELKDKASSLLSRFAAALVDAGERDSHVTVVVEIAATDDGEVFGDADARFGGSGDDARSDHVVEAEDSVGRIGKPHELEKRCSPVSFAVDVGAARLDQVFGRKCDLVLGERVEKSFEATATCAVLRAADVSDALALDGEKMFRCELAGGVVI